MVINRENKINYLKSFIQALSTKLKEQFFSNEKNRIKIEIEMIDSILNDYIEAKKTGIIIRMENNETGEVSIPDFIEIDQQGKLFRKGYKIYEI